MQTPSIKGFIIPLLGMTLLSPGLSLADKHKGDKDKDHEKWAMMHVDPMGEPITADILIGKNVKDSTGKDVGEVEVLIINRVGRITHAVVSFGGVMGIGDDLIPIPWPLFKLDRELVVTPQDSPLQLTINTQLLSDAPRISEPQFPLPGHEVTKLDQANSYFKDEIMEQHKKWKRSHGKSGDMGMGM